MGECFVFQKVSQMTMKNCTWERQIFIQQIFTLEEVAGKIFGVVLELVGWFWLICVIKYVKSKNADKENANNDSDN